MKKPLAIAITLALTSPAYAGDMKHGSGMTGQHSTHIAAVPLGSLEGMAVIGADGTKVGDVDRIVHKDRQRAIILGIDGILGGAAKEIFIPFSEVSISPTGDSVMVNYTKAQLKEMPDVDPGDFDRVTEKLVRSTHAGHKDDNSAMRAHFGEDIEGMDVIGRDGDQVGDIDRVVMKDGVRTAIIGIDGFIGANAKEVAVPMSKIWRSYDGTKLMLNSTQEELKALPDVDPGDYSTIELDNEKRKPVAAKSATRSSSKPVQSKQDKLSLGDKLEGSAVYTKAGKKVGDIDRIVKRNGVASAVIGLDGVIGIGAKEVLVPLDRIKAGHEDDAVVVDMDLEELVRLPDVDPGDFAAIDE